MSDHPWMPFNVEDYLSDTHHLSAAEHGAYMLLIMRYWKDGGLPTDERLIMRHTRLTPDQWAESRDVLAAFFDAGWRHKRIDAELEKAADIIEKRRSAARAKHVRTKPDADAEQVKSTSSDTGVPPVTQDLPSSLRSDGTRKRAPDPAIVLQSVVDSSTARAFADHCSEKRRPLSSQQAEGIVATLRAVKAAGGNAAAALKFAMNKGWVSLELEYLRNNGFPLKTAAPTTTDDWPLDRWQRMLDNYRQRGDWSREALGPAPGEPGCRVPAELIKDAA